MCFLKQFYYKKFFKNPPPIYFCYLSGLGIKIQMILVKWAGKIQYKSPNKQKQIF